MKKLFIPVVALLLGLVLFLACGETGMEEKEEQSLVPTEITQICEDHNEGLEYIYNGLQEADDLSNPEEKISLLAKEFFDMKYMDQSATVQHYFHSGVNIVQEYYEERALAKNTGDSTSSTYYLHLVNELSDSLSDQQIGLLEEIHDTREINDLMNALESLDEIINVKSLLIPEEDRYIIFLAAEMCKHSYTYWHDHLEKWYELFDAEGFLAKRTVWFNWGDVGITDSATAIGVGSAIGLGALIAGPVGWLAAAGAIIGSAVGGSVTQATVQIMNHLL